MAIAVMLVIALMSPPAVAAGNDASKKLLDAGVLFPSHRPTPAKARIGHPATNLDS
jgi:hypothetical protein